MSPNYELEFDEWEGLANFLEEHTWLATRQAQVTAMREAGYHRENIAEELGISTDTVDAHAQDARTKFMKSVRTVQLLKRVFDDGAFEQALKPLNEAAIQDLESVFER